MPEDFKELMRELREEVHALRLTWRRLLIVAVVGVLVIMLGLAGIGAYFIASNQNATDRANQAISDVGNQSDSQAKALRCIENYENTARDRTRLVTRVSTARNRALDARNFAEDAALNAAIAHKPQRRIRHLARIYSRLSHTYHRITRHYYKVLAANPTPKLRKFRCAERAAHRAARHPTPGYPTATVTRTAPAPPPSTIRLTVAVPGPTVTVRPPQRTVTRTVTVAPGHQHGHGHR